MSAVKYTTGLLAQPRPKSISLYTVYAISAAVLVGVFIIAAVGFAEPEFLHNAAHDIRHGLAFPCH